MHDIRLIRDDPAGFDVGLARRGLEPRAESLLALDAGRRGIATRMQEGQNRRNEASKAIGAAMARGAREDAEALKAEVAALKQALPSLEQEEREQAAALNDALAALPNLPAPDVPDGEDESGNVEVARWGTPRAFDFAAKEHADLGPPLGLDFETAAAISGARFSFLRSGMARLNRALGQFMLDRQSEAGFVECVPPLLVRDEAVFGTGQLPKFADDLFETFISLDAFEYADFKMKAYCARQTQAGLAINREDILEKSIWDSLPDPPDRRWLIPTAEVSLTNAVREKILKEPELPLRMTALTPCFRSEAGAAGKDTRGMIRQHQFDKVELVTVCAPEQAETEHEKMTRAAEAILQALELPYRKMLLCAGDMGFSARKTYDLDVWLPGQDRYREISSISDCGDFQARRMNARFRRAKDSGGQKGTAFVHTLNGSGLAVGRTLVAVLENYQQADGSVTVPSALLPYMGGLTKLVPS
jgi:seryl-tRNA synthetase